MLGSFLTLLHRRKKRYSVAGRWRKRNLNYMISQYSRNVTQDNINSVIGSAFQMWQEAANLDINRVNIKSFLTVSLFLECEY